MDLLVKLIIAVGAGYVLGSLPTAYLAGKLLKSRDVRRLGDGNVGAENAYHMLGPISGISVGIIDIGKGVLAVGVADLLDVGTGPMMAAGVAVVIGHVWPVFLQFKGGRGAATTMGVLLWALAPASVISASLALTALATKRGSLAATGMALTTLPFIALLLGQSVGMVLYAIGLPLISATIHLYQVVVPHYHKTGRLSLRSKD